MKVAALVLISTCCVTVWAAPKSRFTRDIKEDALEKEWADPEDEDWHEDTFEWKKKLAEKKQVIASNFVEMMQKPLYMHDIEKLPQHKLKDVMLEREATSGNLQMAFVTVKKSYTEDPKEVEKLGQRWAGMLATNAIHIKVFNIGGQDLLITEDGTRVIEVRDFFLNQPEVEKVRWKDTEFTPTPVPVRKSMKKSKTARKQSSSEL